MLHRNHWKASSAVIGMQGGTGAVRTVWDQLKDHDVLVSAFWLQDWVGKRKTIIGSQLWWNWEVDTTHYAGWRDLVDDLRTSNIRVMAYCNPCLVSVTNEKPNKIKDLFEEAEKLDILVKDKAGSTYMIPNTTFDVGRLDLTHPNASSWFKKLFHEMDCGVRGWMADFGEGLPLDANLFSGEHARSEEELELLKIWKCYHISEALSKKSKSGGHFKSILIFLARVEAT